MIKYIDIARRPEAIVLNLNIGAQIPIPQSAIGRAYLSSLTQSSSEELIDRLRMHEPEVWARNAKMVSCAKKEMNELGFVCSFGDWWPELHAIATVIRVTDEGEPLLISLSGLSSVLTRERVESYFAPAMLNTARSIENRLKSHLRA